MAQINLSKSGAAGVSSPENGVVAIFANTADSGKLYYKFTDGTTAPVDTGGGGGSGTSGTSGTSGAAGAAGAPGTSGTSGTSGEAGAPGTSGTSGEAGTPGTSGTSGAGSAVGIENESISLTTDVAKINFTGAGVVASASGDDVTVTISGGGGGSSGTSGTSGDGTSGTSGEAGAPGTSGTSGEAGAPGTSGTSGEAGAPGTSGTSGEAGAPGTPGTSGTSGSSGTSAQNVTSGTSGTSGATGDNGTSGTSGSSGTSGDGTSGTSGTSGEQGNPGTPGTSGTSGSSGTSGDPGAPGTPGTSGTSGSSGTSAQNVTSGTSGAAGDAGTSGTSGSSGTSGNGVPGTSGTSGTTGAAGAQGNPGTPGTSGTSGSSGTSGAGSAVDITDGITTVTAADKITFSGATVTDQGNNDALVTISGGGGGGISTIYNSEVRYVAYDVSNNYVEIKNSGTLYAGLSWSRSGATISITSTAHGLTSGDYVVVRNMGDTDYVYGAISNVSTNAFDITNAVNNGDTSGTAGAYIPAAKVTTSDDTDTILASPSAGNIQISYIRVVYGHSLLFNSDYKLTTPQGITNGVGANTNFKTQAVPIVMAYNSGGDYNSSATPSVEDNAGGTNFDEVYISAGLNAGQQNIIVYQF